jgi:asparagine synthase (glutamine-hydrolysing)
MCGIAGVWRLGGGTEAMLQASVRAMTDTIAHRGPDGEGQWVDGDAGIGLGHRRLSIIDLSATGRQPMTSADGRFVITYNGEIYNYKEIAAELAMTFRGTSDTEVLVEAIARFGIEGALRRANGIFAFAAFDTRTRTLHLARDRIGVKPLYWMRQNEVVAFASELKALRAVGDLRFVIDRAAAADYFRYAYVPAPRTIYDGVAKLAPGERLEVTAHHTKSFRYWDVAEAALAGQSNQDQRPMAEICDDLHALLADAVKRQMVSDVPIGAFLSGGIDSSTVVALMRLNGPVKTFSIGFREKSYDEAEDAGAVARHLGTEHVEHIFSSAEAHAVIPLMAAVYDEPFADSSQLPTYLVSRLAREQVTVALSGDGGDEIFGGYTRYQGIDKAWCIARCFPRAVRRGAASAIGLLSSEAWDTIGAVLPSRLRPAFFGDKVIKAAGLLEADGPIAMYQRLIAQWAESGRNNSAAVAEAEVIAQKHADMRGLDVTSSLRLLDMLGYLPNDILTKVDRASMAVGLEVRVPILDHRVVEYAWRLPSSRLIGNGKGKLPLRNILDKYVPRNLTERPKMGFGVPIGEWLRGPLRDWSGDLLSSETLRTDGLLDSKVVRARLDEHLSGKRNWQYALWTVLQFQAWRAAYPGSLF